MLMDENGFDAYHQVNVEAQAAAASPYQLVMMLINGFMDNLERAEGHMQAKRFKEKGEAVTKCIDIIGGLNSALDMEKGGELAKQMSGLYEFCSLKLFQASSRNDLEVLGEVRAVMGNVQEAWQNFGATHGY
ncbi:flagellar export chaperone FliS [Thaumasiovibrio sp. DFM-14]|uniref:flagellar export chaperone FliS n=1 Tax=Thaumasiovibrio sp. DFM-14 TaxID=3384792 RepID=UPI0039A031A2